MALSAIKSGDTWLDVRLPEEYENNALANSMNIPLASIRNSYARLEKSKKYIVYCDTGRRSAAAAFLLGKRGFDVSVLEGGLNHGVPDKVMDVAGKAVAGKTRREQQSRRQLRLPRSILPKASPRSRSNRPPLRAHRRQQQQRRRTRS